MSLTRDWWLPRLTARTALLVPFSWVFAGLGALRRALYRAGILPSTRVAVPVIIVGNLTVGGSGKTPLVISLVQHLKAAGYRPGVVSRGYGRQLRDGVDAPLVINDQLGPAHAGDEPLLIFQATRVPTVVCGRRVDAARTLLNAYPDIDVIVSDDGLQHLALARDIEIAVFDCRGTGNGQLLPAGPLREPLSRAAGLTALVYNASGAPPHETRLHQRFPGMHGMDLLPGRMYQLTRPDRVADPAAINSLGRLAAVAGIGHPSRFFETLQRAGLQGAAQPFPDHHPFSRAEIASIDADVILMTEKDALKCVSFGDDRIWVLPVSAQLDPSFFALILETLRGRKIA